MIKRYNQYVKSIDDDSDEEDSDIIYNNENKNVKINDVIEETINKRLTENTNKNKNFEKNKTKLVQTQYCQLCNKKLISQQDYTLHMNSKNHKRNNQKIIKREIKECGTIKKYLIKKKMIAPFRRWGANKNKYLLYRFSLYRLLHE